MATAKRIIDELPIGIAIGKTLALGPDTRINNTDDDIFSCACMRSCAGWTAQLIPKITCPRKPEEARRRRCVDFVQLVRCHRENVALFRDSRSLFLSKLRSKAIEAKRIAINLWATADLSNGFVVFALEVTDVTQSIRGEWINLFALARFCGVVSMNVTTIGDDRGSFHLDDINAVFGCGICRFRNTWLRREEGHGRPRGEKCARARDSQN